MNRPSRILLWIAAGLTTTYALGIAFNVSPWLRGPEEWRWPYVIPAALERALPAAILLLSYLAVMTLLLGSSARRRAAFVLLAAGIMTVLLQMALLYLDHPDGGVSQLFNRTVSELSGGFFNVGAPVTDNRDFLAHFVERMPSYPVHPQRHPPGLPLLFAWARQGFDRLPALAATIGGGLRSYQCHNLTLMNLPDSAIAAATIQMLVPVWLGLVVVPIYLLGRRLYGERPALAAVLLWPLLPSVALWATRWNQLYALFTILAFLALIGGLRDLGRRAFGAFFISGLVVGLATFFSLGNLVIGGFLGLYGAIWYLDQEKRPSAGWLMAAGGFFAPGLLILWGFVWLLFGLNPLALWDTAMSTHLGLGRDYFVWLFYHLYDFWVFFGIPLVVFWMARLARATLRWRTRPRDVLVLSFGLGLLLLDLSGTSQGEVARVWAFLLPLALLAAVPLEEANSRLVVGIAGLLAVQLFVANLFLQPVSTGLTDPPPGPPSMAAPDDPVAVWTSGMELHEIAFPATASAGEEVGVRLTWGATEPIHRPYTVFIHLLDSEGRLVAQADGLPRDGEWLTTCWVPGQAFEDSFTVQLDEATPVGSYVLRAGFYWLPTGERALLPDGSDSVELGAVLVE